MYVMYAGYMHWISILEAYQYKLNMTGVDNYGS